MRILIVGAGQVGRSLARELAGRGNEVIVVDKDKDRCDAITREADVMAINMDATDPRLYEEIDLHRFDTVIAVTDKDEVNLFVALMAKVYNVIHRIARVKDEKVARLMEDSGVAQPVNEAYITAKLIQSLLEGKYIASILVPGLTGNYVLVALTITEMDRSYGKPLREIAYPGDAGKIIAVYDGEKFLDPEEIVELHAGYEVIALVRKDKLDSFIEAFR